MPAFANTLRSLFTLRVELDALSDIAALVPKSLENNVPWPVVGSILGGWGFSDSLRDWVESVLLAIEDNVGPGAFHSLLISEVSTPTTPSGCPE